MSYGLTVYGEGVYGGEIEEIVVPSFSGNGRFVGLAGFSGLGIAGKKQSGNAIALATFESSTNRAARRHGIFLSLSSFGGEGRPHREAHARIVALSTVLSDDYKSGSGHGVALSLGILNGGFDNLFTFPVLVNIFFLADLVSVTAIEDRVYFSTVEVLAREVSQ